MIQSILESTKKNVGIDAGYTAFDPDILMHINTALSTLTQLGIGPLEGLYVEDASVKWDDFFGGDPRLAAVRSYVTLRVRLLFDPPATSFAIDAIKEQIKEMEWRLEVARTPTIPELPITEPDVVLVFDGGDD